MGFTSPFPDVEIPDITVYDFLFGSVEPGSLDRVALIEPKSGSTIDYRQLVRELLGDFRRSEQGVDW